MSLVHLDLNPSAGKLRQFGVISLVMLSALGFFLGWKFGWGRVVIAGFIAAGAVICVLSLISADLVRPVYAGLMIVSYPIGWGISHLMMALFFFGIITPLGLAFRLFGRDALHRKREPDKESYWEPYPRADSAMRYFRQF